MKKLSLMLGLMLCLPSLMFATTVTLKWAPPSTQAWVNCTTTVTTVCLDHLTAFDVTAGLPAGTVAADNIALSATTVSFPGPTPNFVAARSYNLEYAYRDMNGNMQYSAPATCGTSNTAPPCSVTGFTITPPNVPQNFSGSVQ